MSSPISVVVTHPGRYMTAPIPSIPWTSLSLTSSSSHPHSILSPRAHSANVQLRPPSIRGQSSATPSPTSSSRSSLSDTHWVSSPVRPATVQVITSPRSGTSTSTEVILPRPVIDGEEIMPSQNLVQINFDLTLPSWTPSDSPDLSVPATQPPIQSITLTSPDLLWNITVHASSTHVTVLDVVRRLHKSMQKSMKSREFFHRRVAPYQEAIAGSWYKRLESMISEEKERAHEKGVCRIDYLCGKTIARFTGSITEDSGGLKLGLMFSRS